MSTANHRPAIIALTILLALTLGATALAQVGTASTTDPFGLTPVDQGTADLGELNTSNRLIPIDLRQPLDFGRLYQAPDKSGRLMRVSGGLSAVFPRSEYAASAGFVFPVIPAGTEFFIGPMTLTAPTAPAALPEPGGFSPLLIDSRIDLSATGAASNYLDGLNPPVFEQTHATNHPTGSHRLSLEELLTGRSTEPDTAKAPTVWTNERYRQSRIAELLARAMD